MSQTPPKANGSESALRRIVRDGPRGLNATLPPTTDAAEEERKSLEYLNAIVGIKKELTARVP